jgi:hypothetical protein
MAKAFKAQIFLHDEAPRIGCGWRTVTVRLGPKWVRLKCTASGRTARLHRRVWDDSTIPLMIAVPREKRSNRND